MGKLIIMDQLYKREYYIEKKLEKLDDLLTRTGDPGLLKVIEKYENKLDLLYRLDDYMDDRDSRIRGFKDRGDELKGRGNIGQLLLEIRRK